MQLPHISVKRPVATAMIFIAIMVFGLVSLTRLPLDILPELEYPALTVLTVYPGASAEEVEEQVTKIVEPILAGAEQVKEIKSSSRENVSFVQLQYNWGTDVTEAANNARDLLELIKSRLPSEARSPVIYKINSSMIPAVVYAITAEESNNNIEEIIEDKIASRLRKIEGVGTVIYLGQPKREIQVNIDPLKMKAYHLSPEQLSIILKAENITIPGGNIRMGSNDFPVKIPGKIENIAELEELPLVSRNNQVIRLKDVAVIKDTFADDDEYARTPRCEGVALMVQKQSGVNTLDVVRRVRKEMKSITKDLPSDIETSEIISQDEVITESIHSLSSTFWWALVFVVIIVLAFLREWKSSFIIFLTIPFSLIIAFLVMYAIGWTINIFSLMALIIALGMVVDNSIVVLENITHHIEKGSKPGIAAIFGTSEMGQAITASTLTTIMVFIPMIFLDGIVGILFRQLAILTTITLLASLFTALTLTPMVSSKLLKGRKSGEKRKKTRLYNMSERHLTRLENNYRQLLAWALNHKSLTIIAAVLLLVISLWAGKGLGTDYIPEFDAGDIAIVLKTDVGTSAEETDRIAQKVIKILQEKVPEHIPGTIAAISGQTQDGALTTVGFDEGKNISTILCHLSLPDERERTAAKIGDVLREEMVKIPEVSSYRVTAGNILSAAILGNQKPIEVHISGNDLKELHGIANEVMDRFEKSPSFTDLESSFGEGHPEFHIQIDRKRASSLGYNTGMIALQVRQGLYGTDAGSYEEKGDNYDIMIRYNEDSRNNLKQLENFQITSLYGQQHPLSAVAEIEKVTGPSEIQRQSQQRIVKIKAALPEGVSLGEAADAASELISKISLPEDTEIELKGQLSEQQGSFGNLSLILIMGVLLVYMVMAGQFESFKNPFIIILAIPFTLIGVIWALKLTGLTLSITTFIGIIMLMGIVVNNGIVLVDYTNLLRKRDYPLSKAVAEAGRSRLRPVLMTSFTTILAMFPMAMSKGMGHEMFSPLGITIIGGLLVSTIITLILVPVIYASFNRKELVNE